MKSRPTIFLSGVSHEFGSFRNAVENEVEMKGCFAENQPGFPPDYRSVEEMLRRKLDDSDAIVHIVGFRFGAESTPNDAPVDKPRRSYTQLEFDIAREMQKPVYVFLSADESVRDKPRTKLLPEDDEAVALQLEHRKAVQSTNYLYYFFKDKAELCKLVAEIQPVASSGFRSDISRIVKYAPGELIGRDTEMAILNDAWNKVRQAETNRPSVLTFVALGGEGKTSLIAKWSADLAHHDWPGCDAAFAWSFYSQGTREQAAASSDLFLAEALRFFGDAAMADSPAGAFDKGKRLAQLIGERRALLILDGVEPLQYSPSSPTPGELKDQGIAALLKGLASNNRGLCVVTTRYSIPDLKAFWQTTAPEQSLVRLSTIAGVDLLRRFGVKGTQAEFETLVEDVKGHALTLNLLGGFLKRAFKGDIRQRDRVKFEKADDKIQGGHAFRTIAAYVYWMQDESDEARRELAILQLLGLFDRPASADCIQALIAEPAIIGLTDALVGLADEDWEFSVAGLEQAQLLTVNRDATGTIVAIDTHPLIREYFSVRLQSDSSPNRVKTEVQSEASTQTSAASIRQKNDVWQHGHSRLYDYFSTVSSNQPSPTLDELQLLCSGVVHGCLAGRVEETRHTIYRQIAKSTDRIGAAATDLGALVYFFQSPWTETDKTLQPMNQAWILERTSSVLVAMGRIAEAHQCMLACQAKYLEIGDVSGWVLQQCKICDLNVMRGKITASIEKTFELERYEMYRHVTRTSQFHGIVNILATSSWAMFQAGRVFEAGLRFKKAAAIWSRGVLTEQKNGSKHTETDIDGLLLESEIMLADAEAGLLLNDAGSTHDTWKISELQAKADVEHHRAANLRSILAARTPGLEPSNFHSTAPLPPPHGFRFAVVLLNELERNAWLRTLNTKRRLNERDFGEQLGDRGVLKLLNTLTSQMSSIVDDARFYLLRGRIRLYSIILCQNIFLIGDGDEDAASPLEEIDRAIQYFRSSESQVGLPSGLLTRAWAQIVGGNSNAVEAAATDLDEALHIAVRGPMPLIMADVYLMRARLFGDTPGASDAVDTGKHYPWISEIQDLKTARQLIEKHGYWRRKGELEDAEAALLKKGGR